MFKGKTLLISGGSRGIGQAIALRFAQEGANIAILAKDDATQMSETERLLAESGAKALLIQCDLSDQSAIALGVEKVLARFGGIDYLVNNTSATCFEKTDAITPAHYDLVMATSVRAAFFLCQACYPALKKSQNPHIINISPPLNLHGAVLKDHLAFSIGKYAMSVLTLGLSAEWRPDGIAVCSLWPQSTIATQTIKEHFLPEVYRRSRWPSIMADAAFEIAHRPCAECTGHFFLDEELLEERDLSHYAVDPSALLLQSLFVSDAPHTTPIKQSQYKG